MSLITKHREVIRGAADTNPQRLVGGCSGPPQRKMCKPILDHEIIRYHNRRKFRSQTSDNMDRWKSRGGKSQRGEEPKREDQRREIVRRKKMQVREKVGKSRNSLRFSNDLWLRKSRLAKAAGAEPSGQMRDEKLHAVVARSTFPSQNVQNTPCSDHL